MSIHNSLRSHRFSTGVIDRSHPGQKRGSANKRARRLRREMFDTAEATRLGISVSELHVRRFKSDQAMQRQRQLEAVAAERQRERELAQRRSRWGY